MQPSLHLTELQQARSAASNARLVDLLVGNGSSLLPCADLPLGRYREALRSMAEAHGTDLASIGMGLLLVVLSRHSDSTELELGFAEPHAETSRLHVLLQVDLAQTDSFSSLLNQIAERRSAADAGTADGLEDAPPAWLFSCADVDDGGLDESVHLQTAFFDTPEGALLRLRGDGQHFDQSRVEELAAQLGVLMRQVLRGAESAIGTHSLVTAGAREVMPDPAVPIEAPHHRPVAEHVLHWARSTPHAAAISHAGQTMSYSDLAHASARIARQLRTEGVSDGDVVAVTGLRSPGFIVAMLAVWRAGGVLLTLDPKLPLERRRTMMEQAGGVALIRVGANLDEPQSVESMVEAVLEVNALNGELNDHFATGMVALPTIEPEQPAYVFFTSGSTGVPKCVKGRHAGLAHFLDWQRSTFAVGPGDRASQLTALSFDVVLRDTFLALTSGATLCIPGPHDVLDPARILRWLESERVTTIHVVPSLARLWLTQVPAGVSLPALRRVFFAGEPLTDILVTRWREAFPGPFEVVNLYGPTETTLAKCYQVVPSEPEPGVQAIGRCLPQTQALLINGHGGLCGLYEIGQIAIRTPFRTLGYLNNPQAQSLAFVANPWSEFEDDLIYLTGDSGRYLPDGRLRILGRIDNQVKIRGVRIEPGEIEACLLRQPGVREALVLAADDGRGDKMLVAYVVLKAPGEAAASSAAEDLRQALRAKLPENMVPAAYVLLDALPLNANGKVDRKALPPPQPMAQASQSAAVQSPRSALEASVAALWAEVLRLPKVGIDQNFFDLGGHSLMAVHLAQRVRKHLGMMCPVTLLFEAPVLADFCEALQHVVPGGQEASLVALKTTGSQPPLFCVCGAHMYQSIADELDSDRPVYGVFIAAEQLWYDRDHPDAVVAEPTLEAMAADYVQAIRARQPQGPYHLAGLSFGGVLAFEMAQQLRAAGQEVAFLALLDSMLPSARRRHWGKWTVERTRRALRSARQRAALMLARPAAPVEQSVATTQTAATLEQTRLGDLRGAFYRRLTANYAPQPYDGPALLSRAMDKSFFECDIADLSYGWAGVVRRLEVCDVPGDHISHIHAPHVAQLCVHIRGQLDHAV